MVSKQKLHKGKQKAKLKQKGQDKKQRQLDLTKLVATFIITLVIILLLWLFNPEHFLGVVSAFVVGVVYGLVLPYMAHRYIH